MSKILATLALLTNFANAAEIESGEISSSNEQGDMFAPVEPAQVAPSEEKINSAEPLTTEEKIVREILRVEGQVENVIGEADRILNQVNDFLEDKEKQEEIINKVERETNRVVEQVNTVLTNREERHKVEREVKKSLSKWGLRRKKR